MKERQVRLRPILPTFWPDSLKHVAEPLLSATDDYAVVAEVTSQTLGGFVGNRLLFTALVPLPQVSSALAANGGIGQGVECRGPYPSVGPQGGLDTSFWIDGPNGLKYETIINAWLNNNRYVLLPDPGFLMCYGLVPRVLQDGSMLWDDPDLPVHDVVRVMPESLYTVENGHSPARVEIRRDYLEDYLSLKGCAAVATVFDERWSQDDGKIDKLLGGRLGRTVEQPGRTLWLKRANWAGFNQICQVWAARMLLAPKKRPISDPQERPLKWPGRKERIKAYRGTKFGVMEQAFFSDEVLMKYENLPDFTVYPESGGVSHGNWWSVGYCKRVGRNHIAIELRKLYEGTPIYVVEHFHKFAVGEAVAKSDLKKNGPRNIGVRAKEIVSAFSSLVSVLKSLSDRIGLVYTDADIGMDIGDVNYRGWWNVELLRPLGAVVPMAMTYSQLLSRSKSIFAVVDQLKPAALRQILIQLGVGKQPVREFGSLKLLGVLCQLCEIANAKGWNLVSDRQQIVANWDPKLKLTAISVLFSLNDLRVANAHPAAASAPEAMRDQLSAFSIDPIKFKAAWGPAVDRLYDSVVVALGALATTISRAQSD